MKNLSFWFGLVLLTFVSCDKEAPESVLVLSKSSAKIGESVNVTVIASDDKKLRWTSLWVTYNHHLQSKGSDDLMLDRSIEQSEYNNVLVFEIPQTTSFGDTLQSGYVLEFCSSIVDMKGNEVEKCAELLVE